MIIFGLDHFDFLLNFRLLQIKYLQMNQNVKDYRIHTHKLHRARGQQHNVRIDCEFPDNNCCIFDFLQGSIRDLLNKCPVNNISHLNLLKLI